MERKVFPTYAVKVDADQGVVEHIVAVMGNIDEGFDVIRNGAFVKTITERGMKIRCLDQHQTDSIMRVIGKPLEMREIGRDELPPELLMKYPEASGALLAKTQFLMSTPEGKGAFERIKAGAVDEYSIGYDALDVDYSKGLKDGAEVTIRNLRTLKLYEYSPVIWAMNAATTTLSAKSGEPSEGKPYGAVHEGERWCVYKLDEDGNPTGERLGEHDTEEEAMEQVRALYANEGKNSDRFIGEFITEQELRDAYKRRYGDRDPKDVLREILLEQDGGEKSERKAGRVLAARNAERIMNAMNLLREAMEDAGLMEPMMEEEHEDMAAPEKAAESEQQPETKQAGPASQPPTSDELLRLIDIETLELSLMR